MTDSFIDYNVVKFLLRRKFLIGTLEAHLSLGVGFGVPAREPDAQFLDGRRRDEYEDRLRHLLADVAGAFQLDLEDDVPARFQLPHDLALQSPVTVVAVADIFEKVSRFYVFFKLTGSQEVVLAAIYLFGAAGTGSCGP